jgi:hypothetical protein
MTRHRAAIFDMDGVLIDSEPFWREAEIEVFRGVGVSLTEADCALMMGRRIDEVVVDPNADRGAPLTGHPITAAETHLLDKGIHQIGGGSYPPITSPSSSAKVSAVSSSWSGPTIWAPTGSPPGVLPIGATTEGKPGNDACEIQKGWLS